MRTASLASVFFLGLLLAIGTQAETVNLLVNPSFEERYPARKIPRMKFSEPQSRRDHKRLPGFDGEPVLPYGWTVVPGKDGQGRISWEKENGRKFFRVRLASGEKMDISQRCVEVVPGTEYILTLKMMGKGKVRLKCVTGTPAPNKNMIDTTLSATSELKEEKLVFKAEAHRRLARILMAFSGPCDIRLSELGLWVESLVPHVKAGSKIMEIDQDTLFYEGFEDKPLNASGNHSELVEGRYAKGLKVSPEKGGTLIPLSGFKLPEQGTVELWFKADSFPIDKWDAITLAVTTQTAGLSDSEIQLGPHHFRGNIGFGFKKGKFKREGASSSKYGSGWGCWKPGTWHHLAGVWDSQGMRIYVDGVLEGVNYRPGIVLPHGEAVDLRLLGPGVVDEIRISKGNRFAAPVPKGKSQSTWNPPKEKSVKTPSVETVRISNDEIAKAREKLVSPVPETRADHVFSAAKAKASWKGMKGVKVDRDYYGSGHDRMVISNKTHGASAYWKLAGIEPGKYYVGVWVESQYSRGGVHSEYSPEHLLLSVYLNGNPLRFWNTSDPVQVKPGIWLCELQSREAMELKNGDEIAFAPAKNLISGERPVFRLALYKKKPMAGHGVTGQTWGVNYGTLGRLGIILAPSFSGGGKDGEKHQAKILVINPLGCEIRADLTWKMFNYFGDPLWTGDKTVELAPHETVEITHDFKAKGSDQAYYIDVKSKPAKGYRHPFSLQEEWMDFNDYSKVRFRPDMKDPLTAWRQNRFKLKTIDSGMRPVLSLDGKNWELAWLTTRRVPESVPKDIKYRKSKVPYKRLKLPENCFGTWNRKKFVLPQSMRGKRIVFEIKAENEATVFVNGKCFGGDTCYLPWPMIFDVSSAVNYSGENEIVVCVRDAVSLVQEDFVDKYSRNHRKAVEDNLNSKVPTNNWIVLGRTSFLGIELLSEPAIGVRQALVLSDLRKNLLKIMLRVRNSSPEKKDVKISFSIDQLGEKTDTKIPDIDLILKPWEKLEISVKASGKGLIPYEFGNPVISALNVTVEDLDGKVLDKFRKRFGYRSYFVDGMAMNYNGRKRRFMGSSRDLYAQANDVVLQRRASNEDSISKLDEAGYLHYRWVGIPFPKSWKVLNNDHFWKDYQDFAVELMWAQGSHPSLVGLNLSNESYHYASSSVGRDGQKKHAERIASIGEAVNKAFDWNFWFLADGDADLEGQLDFCSFHYLNQQGGFNYKPGTLGFSGDGVAPYSPDCWFLNGAAKIPEKGTEILPHHFVYGSKAFADTESFWFMVNGPSQAGKIGDRAAISSAWQFFTMRGMGWCWQAYEGYRDMGTALMVTMSGQSESFLSTLQKFVWFSMPEQQVRNYGGNKFNRRINLHDDEGKPDTVKFNWTLKDAAGKTVESGEIEEKSNSMWTKRDRLEFKLPKVDERSEFKLSMKISKNGKCYKEEERIIDVWPELNFPLIKQDKERIAEQAVFDPKNLITQKLEKIGWQAGKIDKLDEKSFSGIKRLVIGPDCMTKEMTRVREVLLAFVRKGGRVLVLRQKNADMMPADSIVDKRTWTSNAFVRAPEHPVMKGLTDRDFTMWQPNHLIAKGLYSKPNKGNVLTLLDAGFASLNWSPLLEFYAGKGSLLGCQLMLTDTFEDEPMSAEILKRILLYLEKPVYKNLNSKLFVLSPVSEEVIKSLNGVRAEYEIVNEVPLIASDVSKTQSPAFLLVDLTVKRKFPFPTELKKFVKSGGSLIMHRARPEHREYLSELAGKEVDLEVQQYKSWIDRQILERRDGPMEGLNNLDFYWRQVAKNCAAPGYYQVSSAPKNEMGQVQYVLRTKGALEYLFPGGFSVFPLGDGKIIFDQLAWELPDQKNTSFDYGILPSRTISVILTNLGVTQTPPSRKMTLPKGVVYEPVDISKVANRGLKDDKGGDGVGWKDWGPEADLRTFPTGKVTFNRVPFLIPKGNKNAIVLPAAKKIIATMPKFPERIVIPLNKSKVAGLWFLQTGGWTGGSIPYAHREIIYRDGSKEIIQLSGLNFADWNLGRDEFPDEKDTRTIVAWKGSTETWPLVRVYQQLWLNPHPEKEIKEVALSVEGQAEKNRRFVAHLGLTAAILPEKAYENEQKKRDPEKSRRLFREAQRLLRNSQEKEALAKAEEAVKADNKNVSAWGLISEIKVKTAEVADFEKLCQEWVSAVPSSYQAWNVLGWFYESKKLFPKAIKAYRKSLEIEWNQPAILLNLNKLEKGK